MMHFEHTGLVTLSEAAVAVTGLGLFAIWSRLASGGVSLGTTGAVGILFTLGGALILAVAQIWILAWFVRALFHTKAG